MTGEPLRKTENAKEKRRSNIPTSGKIGGTFIAAGIIAFVFSVYSASQIVAFIGLGITFWGALFLLITPVGYVEGSLLTSTADPTYAILDRIITDFKYGGKAHYIPPYPQDVYLPEHLKGLKDTVIFVSAQKEDSMPSVEEIAQGKFLLTNPKGILVTPPGIGLLNQIERKKPGITKTEISDLCEVLPQLILENFGIAKDLTMLAEADRVTLTIRDSLYTNLYDSKSKKTLILIGCPIASAIACVLATASGKAVTILKTKISPDGLIVETEFQIGQADEE